jgi:hypothetical protein
MSIDDCEVIISGRLPCRGNGKEGSRKEKPNSGMAKQQQFVY